MLFDEFVEYIECSEEFKSIKEKYPDLELCTGFFVLDFIGKDNKGTLDYITKDKVFTFSLNENNVVVNEDALVETEKNPLTPITPKLTIQVNELKGIVGFEALEQGVHEKFQKIIVVLQNYKEDETNEEKTLVWNLTCILDNLKILHVLIDANNGNILKFEKKNLMDFVRK
ncbi:hypothetical protein J4221_05875 [Candidatus Pacearchaeota archaeon]|nr:hypothetical protein [Candidatus Pacearchaeota archaeon]